MPQTDTARLHNANPATVIAMRSGRTDVKRKQHRTSITVVAVASSATEMFSTRPCHPGRFPWHVLLAYVDRESVVLIWSAVLMMIRVWAVACLESTPTHAADAWAAVATRHEPPESPSMSARRMPNVLSNLASPDFTIAMGSQKMAANLPSRAALLLVPRIFVAISRLMPVNRIARAPNAVAAP